MKTKLFWEVDFFFVISFSCDTHTTRCSTNSLVASQGIWTEGVVEILWSRVLVVPVRELALEG